MLCGYVWTPKNAIEILVHCNVIIVRNIWSTWSTWSQTTNSGPCPDTRTRTRSCVADPSVIGVNATQPVCVGTCSLDFTESEPQRVDTPRCPGNGGGNGGVNGTLATNTGMFHVTKHGLITIISMLQYVIYR